MSDIKWIKICTDVFDNWKIKLIKSMPSGHELVCVWFELLCMAGSCNDNGRLIMSGKVVANAEMIATIYGEDVQLVKIALETFERLGMITCTDYSEIEISGWCEYQNVAGLEHQKELHRERQRKYREREKAKKICDVTRDASRDVICDEKDSISISLNNTNNNINKSIDINKNNIPNNQNTDINKNVINDIINYLNNKLGTRYRTAKKTTQQINARLKEGFEYEDFLTVIDKKFDEWHGTDMEKYLRPETLFGTKFEGYLNQLSTKRRASGDSKLDAVLHRTDFVDELIADADESNGVGDPWY